MKTLEAPLSDYEKGLITEDEQAKLNQFIFEGVGWLAVCMTNEVERLKKEGNDDIVIFNKLIAHLKKIAKSDGNSSKMVYILCEHL